MFYNFFSPHSVKYLMCGKLNISTDSKNILRFVVFAPKIIFRARCCWILLSRSSYLEKSLRFTHVSFFLRILCKSSPWIHVCGGACASWYFFKIILYWNFRFLITNILFKFFILLWILEDVSKKKCITLNNIKIGQK